MEDRRAVRLGVLGVGVVIAASGLLTAPAAAVGPPGSVTSSLQVLAPPASVRADAPFDVTDQITDRAGVLGDTSPLESDLDRLLSEHGLQLFVVYVGSFDGASGEEWARQTYELSGMGGNDILLAVATGDRRYSTWTTSESGLTAEQDQQVRSQYIEPALANDDWAGAVSAAAEGYGLAASGGLEEGDGGTGSGGGGGPGGGFPWWLLVPVGGGVALYALSRRRSRRRQPSGPRPAGAADVPTDALRQQAAAALVAVDDAIRSSGEELAFAQAQFGVQATQHFEEVLATARTRAADAFRLQRSLDDDEGAGLVDDPTRRARLTEIITLASEADRSLGEQEAEFARMRDLQARVPEFLTELRGRHAEVVRRVPAAEQELAGLRAQFRPEALQTVEGNVGQARRLLDSADEFVATGQAHLEGGDRAAAVAAGRAAEEAIGQADRLLTAVGQARTALAEAPARIDAALASISSDVADAERLGADDQLTVTALAAARQAIADGTAGRDRGDPLAALRLLARAEQDLDNALARYRSAEADQQRRQRLLEQRVAQVGARLASIDELISSRRGAVGGQARAHIANALRLHGHGTSLVPTDPVQAAALLTEAEAEGEQALRLAHDDIGSWGSGGFGGGIGGGVPQRGRGLDPASVILGGILAGGFGGGGRI